MAGKTKKRQQVKKGPHGGTLLVLVEDVPHLGKQGQVVEVKPGYARNYLLPNGLATIPTEHNLKMLERYKIKVQQAREARIADLRMLAEQIQRLPQISIPGEEEGTEHRLPHITIEAVANEEGHLYGSVGPQDISRVLNGKNLKVEPDMVHMDHIKECALYQVDLHLGYEIETKVAVMVVPKRQQ